MKVDSRKTYVVLKEHYGARNGFDLIGDELLEWMQDESFGEGDKIFEARLIATVRIERQEKRIYEKPSNEGDK